jgi:tRNA dimethylallyltransferase
MSSSDDSAGAETGVIVGPTAAGKSALAMWLAERHPIMIVSADSRQIYRRFDVGTAKPSAEERARVPHAGLDIVNPTERFSAFSWAASAARWVSDARLSGRTPLIVGGTGLYVRALVEPSFWEPEVDPARRAAIQEVIGRMPTTDLRRWVDLLDAERTHLGRTQLIRAVEVALLTGRRLSSLYREAPRPPSATASYLVVDPGPLLRDRISSRARSMLDGNWQAEVSLLVGDVPDDAPAWQSTGYRTVRSHVRGELSLESALEQIVVATRQYAKRQRTWFRNQLPPERVTHVDPYARDWETVVSGWYERLPTGADRAKGRK